MAHVFITQIPTRKDPNTGLIVNTFDISGAEVHGTPVIIFNKEFSDVQATARAVLSNYNYYDDDSVLLLGSNYLIAAACFALCDQEVVTILRWNYHKKRYEKVKMEING